MNILSAGLICSLRLFGVTPGLAVCLTELWIIQNCVLQLVPYFGLVTKSCVVYFKSCLCLLLEKEEITFFIREMTNYSDIPSHSLVLGQKNLMVIVIIVT